MRRHGSRRRLRARQNRFVAGAVVLATGLGVLGTFVAPAAAQDGCVTVDLATSGEKLDLLTNLAKRFGDADDNEVDGRCIDVNVFKVASGGGELLLENDWPKPKANGPRPVIWSPSASTWGAVLNQRRTEAGKSAMAPTAKAFMLTPLVIAMPKPMAEALGWPADADRLRRRARARAGPGRLGGARSPRVGPVPLRQDQPELLDQRPRRDGRAVLRGDGQDAATSPSRTSRGPTSRRSRAASSRRSSTTATRR